MRQNINRVWIKIAGNSQRIREGEEPYWRCQIDGDDEIIPLRSWQLLGMADLFNNRAGVNPKASGDQFLAWVAYFGNVRWESNDRITIELINPEQKF